MSKHLVASEGMTLREHLDELRKRLMFISLFLVIGVVAAFVFRDYIMEFLLEPGGFDERGEKPIATEVLETVSVMFKVSFMVGFVASLPVILYQLVRFVSPGLTGREKAYLYLFLPGVLVAFAGGAAFAYLVLLPPALEFLFEFGGGIVDPETRISSYISVVTALMFWMGVVFQLPLVLFALARFGIVTPRFLSRFRRFAIVLAFIAAAIITPTFDPVNQTLVAVPIIILYEIGIVLARIGHRLRQGVTPKQERGPGLVRRTGRRLAFWRWRPRFRFWRS
jgi:sec-independent protein translocase protein TatC